MQRNKNPKKTANYTTMKKLLLLSAATLMAFTTFAEDESNNWIGSPNNNTLDKNQEYVLDIHSSGRVVRAHWAADESKPATESRYFNISSADQSGVELNLRMVTNTYPKAHSKDDTSIINANGTFIQIKGTFTTGLYKATLDFENNTLTVDKAESIDVTVDKYSTFISPVEVKIPEGIKVYSLSYNGKSNSLVATEIKETLEPNKSVILVSSEAADTYIYSFDIIGESYDYIPGTCLYGSSNSGRPTIKNVEESLLASDQESYFNPQFIGLYQPRFYYATGANADSDLDGDIYILDNEKGNFNLIYSSTGNGGKIKDTNAIHQPLSSYLRLNSIAWDEGVDLSTLEIVFPEEEEQIDFSINLGENTWEQSGTVENNKIEITIQEDNDDAYIFVEVGDKVEAIYYYIDDSGNEGEEEVEEDGPDDMPSVSYVNQRRRLPANATYSVAKVKDGITTIHLNVGSGQLYIATSADGDNEQVFTYTVAQGVPTAVEAVETAAEENGTIYNIFGQKVDASYKGIVIKNGKKFIQR